MATSVAPTSQSVWRPAVAAGIAGAFASVAVLPYAMALSPGLLARISVPLAAFLGLQFVQALAVFTFLGWAGCRLADAAGLITRDFRPPGSDGTAAKPTVFALQRTGLTASIAAGCLTGLALLALARLTEPFMPATIGASILDIALWKRLAASFYGGIAEEIICRLFLMSLLVWLARRFLVRSAALTSAAAWIGIIGAALLFGIGHLPAAATQWPLTIIVVVRILTLNAVGGIVFGWLYWRRGLAHAMVAHFLADIVLHGIGSS